jgi:hypothetical protein
MRVHSFQGEILAHGTTWNDLKEKVKATPRPWTFVFAGTVRVEVAEGGAGFAANEDLTVKKIDEGKACEQAGVVLGMHVVRPPSPRAAAPLPDCDWLLSAACTVNKRLMDRVCVSRFFFVCRLSSRTSFYHRQRRGPT